MTRGPRAERSDTAALDYRVKPGKDEIEDTLPEPKSKPEPKQKPEPEPKPKIEPEPDPEIEPEPVKKSWFGRLKSGLAKSSNALTSGITGVFTKRKLDADTIQDFEDILIQADLGIDMATRIIEKVSKGRFDKEIDPEEVKQILADEITAVLEPVEIPFTFDESQKTFCDFSCRGQWRWQNHHHRQIGCHSNG